LAQDLTVLGRDFDLDSAAPSFDLTVWATGLVRVGEVEVDSIDDMVFKVGGRLRGDRLRYLRYFGHGSGGGFSIGKDAIAAVNPKRGPLAGLARLAPHFAEGGAVCLYVCELGQRSNIVAAVAEFTGVPAYACKGSISPNIGFILPTGGGIEGFWGPVVVAYPDGTIRSDEGLAYPDRRGPAGRTLGF